MPHPSVNVGLATGAEGSVSGPWELAREHTAGGRPVVSKTHISTWEQVADCLITQWSKTKGGQDVRGSLATVLPKQPGKDGSITTPSWFGKINPAQRWGEGV